MGTIENPGFEKLRAIAKAMGFPPKVEFEEGVGKAYRYVIQGRPALLVEWIGGDYTSVVGLPLALTSRMLAGFGIKPYY